MAGRRRWCRCIPTQLYEAAALGVLVWLLIRWRRQGVPDANVLGRYLACAGTIRFAIEFVRVNRPIAGPLTLAQLIAADPGRRRGTPAPAAALNSAARPSALSTARMLADCIAMIGSRPFSKGLPA